MKRRLFSRQKPGKALALIVAAAMLCALMPIALMGATIPGEDYVPSDDKSIENWQTGVEIDSSNAIISKEVTSRSASNQWDIKLTVTPKNDITVNDVAIAIVLDNSNSMNSPPGGSNYSILVEALREFIDDLKANSVGNVQISITSFNKTAIVVHSLSVLDDSFNIDDVLAMIDTPNGGTNIQSALEVGVSTLTGLGSNMQKHLVLFTDGAATWCNPTNSCAGEGTFAYDECSLAAIAAATAVKESGVTIHAIGFNIYAHSYRNGELSDIVKGALGNIASEGSLYEPTDAIGLKAAFDDIRQATVPMVTDIVPELFSIIGNAEGVTFEIVGGEEHGDIIYDNTGSGIKIIWKPGADNKVVLGAGVTLVINYTVTLDPIPDIGTNGGVYDHQETNRIATLNNTGSSATPLEFPVPAVRYEVGKAIVNLVDEEGNSLNYILTGKNDGSPYFTSNSVITDFTPNGDENVTDIARAPNSFKNPNGPGTYVLKAVKDETLDVFSNVNDYRVTNDSDSFEAALPTGISEITYVYVLELDGLRITKVVTGNGAPADTYEFTFTLKYGEVTKDFSLANGKSIVFPYDKDGLTADTAVTITETGYVSTNYSGTSYKVEDGESTLKTGTGRIVELTISSTDSEIEITFTNSYASVPVTTPPVTTPPVTTPPVTTPPVTTPPVTTPPVTTPPETVIEDEDPILDDFPEDIDDPEVPLDEAPNTSDSMMMTLAAILIPISAAGIIIVCTTGKKNKDFE